MPQGVKRSIIKKYFTDEMFLELFKITKIVGNNNEKNLLIKELLRKYNVPFTGLGPGTNRVGVLIDGYAVKFALDQAGMIDNRREFKYSKMLQPYVVKVYECVPNGLIMVCEFVEIFNIDDFHTCQGEMASILSDISENFLIGDVGITSKNYVNWGKRIDGSICILDFAYIYSVSYNTFNCNCEAEALLKYDSKFINLICPVCGRKYEFGEIRKRITKQQEENEIGDIRKIGYNLHHDSELVELVPEFEPVVEGKKKKKKVNEVKQWNKEHRKEEKRLKEERKYGISEYDEN